MDVIFELIRNLLPPTAGDAIGVFVSAILTFMVFTYVFGDNVLFRLAQHILIGTVAAYAVVVAVHSILLGRLLLPLIARSDTEWPLIIPLILGVLLWGKARPHTAWLGNISMGFMLGVGAALAIGGALLGTLMPQLQDTAISLFNRVSVDMTPSEQLAQIASNIMIVFGTLGALLSFHFVRGGATAWERVRNGVLLLWGSLGQLFIWIAFGALFAGFAISRITLLVSRVQFLLDAFRLSVR